MKISSQPGNKSAYQIYTNVYNGPLDLLLELIERAELDITRFALAQVTDQYLDYLEQLEYKDPMEISYFLIVAARLIQIKSEALLPIPPERQENEEDPGEALAAQLILYKKFKEASQFLVWQEEYHRSTFLHIPPEIKVEGTLDLSDISMDQLLDSIQTTLSQSMNSAFNTNIITLSRLTIREKIGEIIATMREKGTVSFSSILSDKSNRLETVVAFLALLELVKQHVVDPQQNELFSEIYLVPVGDISEPAEFTLEFGE